MSDENDLEIKITAQFAEVQSAFAGLVETINGLKGSFAGLQDSATSATASLSGIKGVAKEGADATSTLARAQAALTAKVKEMADTATMSSTEILRYKADMLGIAPALESEIQSIEHGRAAREDQIRSFKVAEQAARQYAAVIAQAERENAAFDARGQAFIATLERQIAVLRQGAEAGLEYDAAVRGVTAEAAPLIAQIAELNAEHAEAAATLRAFAAAEREEAAAARQAAASNEENASAIRLLGGVAHGSRGALYELTVVMHELTAGRFRQALSSSTILLSKLAVPIGVATGFAIAASVALSMAKNLGAAVEQYEKLSNQAAELGVSTAQLQALDFASQQLGIKTESLTSGMARLDNAFARARAGAKQQQDAFGALHINLAANYTQTQLLQAVLANWGTVAADGPRKVTIATELFGKSGRDLIPILDELASHQDELNAKMAQHGIINDEAVAKGKALAVEYRDVQAAAQGLGEEMLATSGQLLISVMQTLSSTLDTVRRMMVEANDPTSQLSHTIQTLGQILNAVAVVVGSYFVASMGRAVLAAVTASGAFTALAGRMAIVGLVAESMGPIEALGVLFTGLASDVGLATAAFSELTLALLASPLVWATAAVAGLAFAYESLTQKTAAEKQATDDLNTSVRTLSEANSRLFFTSQDEKNAAIQSAEAQLALARAHLVAALAADQHARQEAGAIDALGRSFFQTTKLTNGSTTTLGQFIAGTRQTGQAVQDLSVQMKNLEDELAKLGNTKVMPGLDTTGGDPTKQNKEKQVTIDLEAELKAQLDARHLYGDAAIAYETQFWNNILATANKGTKQGYEQWKQATDALRELQVSADSRQRQEADSAAEAQVDIEKSKQAAILSQTMSGLEAQLNAVKKSVADKITSGRQGLAEEIELINQEKAAKLAELQAVLAAEETAALAKMRADQNDASAEMKDAQDLLKATQAYETAKLELVQQTSAKIKELTDDLTAKQVEAANQQQKAWTNAFDRIADRWAKTTVDLTNRTTSWASVWRSLLNEMFTSVVAFSFRVIANWAAQEAAKTVISSTSEAQRMAIENGWLAKILGLGGIDVAKFLTNETVKTSATAAGNAARTASTSAAAAAAAAANAPADLAQITADSGVAAAGVFAAAASNPATVWAAPALAAAAQAEVMSYAAFSAAGGIGEVPYDGAMFKLHEKETVLPANIATPLRAMVQNPSFANAVANSNQAPGEGGDMHLHIHAVDAKSVQRLFEEHGDKIAKVVQAKWRGGAKIAGVRT